MHESASIAILTGLFFTVMLSEDSAIVSGALLALNGVVPAWQAFLACFLGMWSSDFTIYLLVKTGGARALDSRWGRALVSREKVDLASGWVTRFGGFALVFSPRDRGQSQRVIRRRTGPRQSEAAAGLGTQSPS